MQFSCCLDDGELGLPGARRFFAIYTLRTCKASATEIAACKSDGATTEGAACELDGTTVKPDGAATEEATCEPNGTANKLDGAAFACKTPAEYTEGAELVLTLRCETDHDTYVNMTNHTYFNLQGAGSGSALGALVTLRASHFLPIREDSVSAGEIRPVAHTPFDFTSPKRLDADIAADDIQLARARGYDHCFVIDGYEPGTGARPALCAHDPASGRVLEILITQPGAHLYTGNWLNDHNAKRGASFEPGAGFAFEPEFFPDNVHHADWEHPVCTPDTPWSQTIVYRFSTVDPA
ncbi:hypothetical protein K6V98_03715 [Collinsella sp. AGMB00827]|uniref:Aldose 1-epimerase n=1 Tax=Collinsella ureilytica TaxID=2869515 RepID=A0ABS7MJD2_9ACTN|nr:hypothetical protein [Collinsella urealyticum]